MQRWYLWYRDWSNCSPERGQYLENIACPFSSRKYLGLRQRLIDARTRNRIGHRKPKAHVKPPSCLTIRRSTSMPSIQNGTTIQVFSEREISQHQIYLQLIP